MVSSTTLNKNFQNTLKCLNKKLPKPLKDIAKEAFIIYLRYWKIIWNDLCFRSVKLFYTNLVPTAQTLREKCSYTDFALVRMHENTDRKKLRIWKLFTQWNMILYNNSHRNEYFKITVTKDFTQKLPAVESFLPCEFCTVFRRAMLWNICWGTPNYQLSCC